MCTTEFFSIKVFWVRKFTVLQSDVITRGLVVETSALKTKAF